MRDRDHLGMANGFESDAFTTEASNLYSKIRAFRTVIRHPDQHASRRGSRWSKVLFLQETVDDAVWVFELFAIEGQGNLESICIPCNDEA